MPSIFDIPDDHASSALGPSVERGSSVADDDLLRIGDSERDAAIAALSRQFAEGRLTPDEFSSRCGMIGAALMRGDLKPAFLDLPVSTALFVSTTPVIGEGLARQRAQFAVQRATLERRKTLARFLEKLFHRLQFGCAAAALISLVLAFFSMAYGSGDFGWIIAIVAFAAAALISTALRAFVIKNL